MSGTEDTEYAAQLKSSGAHGWSEPQSAWAEKGWPSLEKAGSAKDGVRGPVCWAAINTFPAAHPFGTSASIHTYLQWELSQMPVTT